MLLKEAARLCAQSFTVHGSDGSEEKIYIRTVSDPEKAQIGEAQAAYMIKLRESYVEGKPKREALLTEIDAMSDERIANMLVQADGFDILKQAKRKVSKLMPLDLSKCKSEDERLKLEEEHEALKLQHAAEINDAVHELCDEREKRLLEQGHENLVRSALRLAINIAINQDAEGLSDDYRILYGVYCEDQQTQYFNTIDEVRALPNSIKETLTAAINQVEMVKPVDIKNSQGRSVLLSVPAETTPEATPESSTIDSPE